VDGRGLARLAAAGVEVLVGVGEAEARALNRGFLTAAVAGRPHVTLKTAMTLDGRIVGADGASRWITGEAARAEAHRMRFLADAVMVGIGTALADDPRLTVRRPDLPPKEPWRVVVDSRLRLPPAARLIGAGDPGRVLVACAGPATGPRAEALRARGVRLVGAGPAGGRVDLAAVLASLPALDVLAVLVEGGAELAWGLLEAGLVDRVAFFVAPRLLGGRGVPGPVGGPGRPLAGAVELGPLEVRPVGEDLLLEADVAAGPGGEPRPCAGTAARGTQGVARGPVED
jgi:diaminohydroxyphosphoribosylaminopyrimidine deaminase/5-amino-6-(5-phosphoribosylamino)uracil reductase